MGYAFAGRAAFLSSKIPVLLKKSVGILANKKGEKVKDIFKSVLRS